MSKDHEGDNKEYIHTKRAWYASTALEHTDYVDSVTFGFYAPHDGTSGEMSMKWYKLTGTREVPRLEVFAGSWHALAQFEGLIDALAEVDDGDITPEQFCAILDQCGFTDRTPLRYEDSYPQG